jgi:hypothetical protein
MNFKISAGYQGKFEETWKESRRVCDSISISVWKLWAVDDWRTIKPDQTVGLRTKLQDTYLPTLCERTGFFLSIRRESIKFLLQIVFIILYVHSQLDLTLQSEEGGDISNFNTNGEWDLLGMATVTACTRLPLSYFFFFLSVTPFKFFCHCSLLIQNVFSAPNGSRTLADIFRLFYIHVWVLVKN